MKLLFILLLTIPTELFSQKLKLKNYAASGAFVFLSGMSDGLRDASMFRMDGYGNFWNGKKSWLNKYKNRDRNAGEAYFGSKSFLVFTTDAAHLSNAATHQFQAWSYVFTPYDTNRKFGHLLLKGLAYNIVRQAGHFIIYDVVFAP